LRCTGTHPQQYTLYLLNVFCLHFAACFPDLDKILYRGCMQIITAGFVKIGAVKAQNLHRGLNKFLSVLPTFTVLFGGKNSNNVSTRTAVRQFSV
jgi:hypothetical protein